jgi:predicted nuclease with TOPRIM domain
MTETTREGTDVVERAAMAHCAKAVDLGLIVTPWDGLRQVDRVVARMCMEAATADMRAKLTRLRSENERLREALGATRAEVAEILKNIIECRAANFVGVAHPRFDEESQKEIARLEALLRKADGALQQGEKLEETSNG